MSEWQQNKDISISTIYDDDDSKDNAATTMDMTIVYSMVSRHTMGTVNEDGFTCGVGQP